MIPVFARRRSLLSSACGLLLALTATIGTGKAQENTPQNDQLSKLCEFGLYDEAIQQASTWIEMVQANRNLGQLDPSWFYWRGVAEYNIGRWGQSRIDMALANQAGIEMWNDSPKDVLLKIAAIEAVLPPKTEEVKTGNNVAFRVYYSQKDPQTKAIIESLPTAYKINSELYGTDLVEQPVIIFNTAAEMQFFMTARGHMITNWAYAYGGRDVFYFCLETPDGEPLKKTKKEWADTVTHEFNHCLFQRAMGNVTVPSWFVEGIAMYAVAQISPDEEDTNDRATIQLMQANRLLDPREIEDAERFLGYTGVATALAYEGVRGVLPSPYTQGFNMTRFLLNNMEEGQLQEFLNAVKATQSFERAMNRTFGSTLPQFYASWHQDVQAKLQ